MKFVSFLIVCAVALVAYYLYLILAPEKKSQMFDDGRREGSMETIIEIEPIEVSADMVTYQPQAAVEYPDVFPDILQQLVADKSPYLH